MLTKKNAKRQKVKKSSAKKSQIGLIRKSFRRVKHTRHYDALHATDINILNVAVKPRRRQEIPSANRMRREQSRASPQPNKKIIQSM